MNRVNTRDRILRAALKLFVEQGYQKTSIAQIEAEAGLVPRAGALYRHFDSKQSLLREVTREYVSESPEEFGMERLADFGDTRSQLVAIALKYEAATIRQRPYARLIEEIRLLDFGADLQDELNENMRLALTAWIKARPAAQGLSRTQVTALLINVFGGWLYYLTMLRQGAAVEPLRDTLLDEWATRWAAILDTPPP